MVKDHLHIFIYEKSVHISGLFIYKVAERFLLILEAPYIKDIENVCSLYCK